MSYRNFWYTESRLWINGVPCLAKRIVVADDRSSAISTVIAELAAEGKAEPICATPATDAHLTLAALHPRGWPEISAGASPGRTPRSTKDELFVVKIRP